MVSSDVRYVFRSEETDVDVTIEGKKEWVQGIVDELGLSDVGTMLPLASNLIAGPIGIFIGSNDILCLSPTVMSGSISISQLKVILGKFFMILKGSLS